MLRRRIRELDMPFWVRNRALHYIARDDRLSDTLHYKLSPSRARLGGNCLRRTRNRLEFSHVQHYRSDFRRPRGVARQGYPDAGTRPTPALWTRIGLAQHVRLAIQNEIGWVVADVAANGLRRTRITSMARDRIGAFGISRTGKIAITAILRCRRSRQARPSRQPRCPISKYSSLGVVRGLPRSLLN
jgi:hypothetical protein